MTRSFLRQAAVSGTALAAAALLITAGLLLAPRAVPFPALADVVPANRTILLAVHADADTLRSLHGLLPPLPLPPLDEHPRAFAIVRSREGTLGWIREITEDGKERFDASDPLAMMRTDAEEPLSDAEEFNGLYRLAEEDRPWLYAAPSLLGASGALMAGMVEPHRPIALSSASGGVRIGFIARHAAPSLPTFAPAFADPGVAYESPSVEQAYALWLMMPQHLRAAVSALGSTVTASLLGPSVSLRYDLLPLMRQPFGLYLKQQATGSLLFAWQGEVHKEDAAQTATLLHASFADTLPLITVRQRALADGYEAADVSVEEEAVERRSWEEGEWTLQETAMRDASALLRTAWGNGRLLIANDAEAMERMRMPVPQGFPRGIIEQGYLSGETIRRAWRLLHGETAAPDLPALAQHSVHWTLEQQGPLTVLTLRPDALPR